MEIKFYYFDQNRRVYEMNGVTKSAPFQEGYYILIKVLSETDKEYVCEWGTINKRSMMYSNGRYKTKAFTEKEKTDDVYIAENSHLLAEKVRRLPADVLRKVEEIIINSEKNETHKVGKPN